MPSQAVADAVAARLAASWTLCPVIGANLQGEPPSDASPFLSVQYPISIVQQITIGTPGSQVWRESGTIRFVIERVRGQGTAIGFQWCDTLAALFRGKKFSGVNTWGPSTPVVDSGRGAGNYWSFSFVVEFYFNFLG